MPGRGGLFENETLKDIGWKYTKTTAQVMLRWNIQRGVIVLPKSTHKERMVQNMGVFDFSLTQEDMGAIAVLDTKTSAFFSHYDPNMVEWFVKMVEERKKDCSVADNDRQVKRYTFCDFGSGAKRSCGRICKKYTLGKQTGSIWQRFHLKLFYHPALKFHLNQSHTMFS